MNVREFCSEDKAAFLRMNENFYSSGATLRGYDEELALMTFKRVVDRHENLWGYIMEDKETNEAVGYALVTSYWCNEDGGNVIILDELFIDPDKRHKGYGKQCMEWVEKEFAGAAVSITLEVLTTNVVARQLYAKEGFTEDGFQVLTKKLSTDKPV